MKRILTGLMLSILFIGILLSYQALAEIGRVDAAGEKAVILFMQGDVKVKADESAEWTGAAKGMVLSKGYSLKIGPNSWAEIGLGIDYRNVVRVRENTLIELTDLGPVDINLLKGELRALVEKLSKDETFEIRAPMSVCGVRGTGWDINTDGIKVVVDVYEDEVYFSKVSEEGAAMEDPIVNAGKRATLEDPTKPIIIKDLPIDRMNDWSRWKEDFIERRDTEVSKEKLEEKVKQQQEAVKDIIKGKEGVLEQKDQESIEDRLEESGEHEYKL